MFCLGKTLRRIAEAMELGLDIKNILTPPYVWGRHIAFTLVHSCILTCMLQGRKDSSLLVATGYSYYSMTWAQLRVCKKNNVDSVFGLNLIFDTWILGLYHSGIALLNAVDLSIIIIMSGSCVVCLGIWFTEKFIMLGQGIVQNLPRLDQVWSNLPRYLSAGKPACGKQI